MSRASLLTASSVLVLGLSGFGAFVTTGVAHAGAPAQMCNDEATICMNRKQGCTSQSGTCKIIAYSNTDDYNEYFRFKTVNLCNGSFTVTDTCPFANGGGMNTDNVSDWIGQLTVYNSSGASIGCVGDDQSGNTVMLGCNGSNGTGGGTGTIYVQGSAGPIGSHWIPNGFLANRYESNKFFNLGLSYPEVLDWTASGNQLITDAILPNGGGIRWDQYGF
ncbi:MAG TPA: hypothetical protein VLG47_06090 [Candidatus Saccharimonadales bacterium]|nr:hypothetical protein [Candidatus Saccharimonadales bacterium]